MYVSHPGLKSCITRSISYDSPPSPVMMRMLIESIVRGPHYWNRSGAYFERYTCQFGQLCPPLDWFQTCFTFFFVNNSSIALTPLKPGSSVPQPIHSTFSF